MDALNYARELIAFKSPSAVSNVEISDHVERTLAKLGFATEHWEYDDAAGVRKCSIVAKKGEGTGGVAYFGHTDVVPADTWFTDEFGPYEPTIRDDRLYGRGSCDMKGSIATMLAAAGRFSTSELNAPIYITCTADEEVGYFGAKDVAERSEFFREMVAGNSQGIIGEPTCLEVVHAHKGSYGFRAISHGKASHSSTRNGLNANLAMIPFLAEMKAIHDETEADAKWQNAEYDPPTVSWNIGINDHTKAINITPPQSVCTVYFRAMPGVDAESLMDRAQAKAEEFGLEFRRMMGSPALYLPADSDFVREILQIAGRTTPQTVSYGTDGSCFVALQNLVVFGPGDIAQAHTHDEWISLEQLERGTDLYARAIRRWCC